MISTVIALPYELARLPLVLIDNNLSPKLPETFGPRLGLHRAIGWTDKVAGALLGNPDIAKRGADRIERSDKLRTAAHLEQEAATRREQIRETSAAARKEAAEKRKTAQDRAASGIEEADAAEARGKHRAKATATKTASAKKAAADQRAASRIATVEQRQRRVDSAAQTKKQAAQRKAKDELNDARETKQSAAEARADAERLSDLTEARKRKRKEG